MKLGWGVGMRFWVWTSDVDVRHKMSKSITGNEIALDDVVAMKLPETPCCSKHMFTTAF
jgi:hypothetical protein